MRSRRWWAWVRRLALAGVTLGLFGACTGGGAHSTLGAKQTANIRSSPSLPNPFTITAHFTAQTLGLKHPIALALGPDGNAYVTDAKPSVTVISPTGEVLRRWGKQGSGRGEFSFVSYDQSDPSDLRGQIAVGADGRVYVSDSGNARVDVFSAMGTFIRALGSRGLRDGQFQHPFDLAVDAQGATYVADDLLSSLLKFSPSGRFDWSIGGANSSDPDFGGHFVSPMIDSHGRVVVGVDDSHRIVYVDARGHKVDSFSTEGLFRNDWGPCSLTVDMEGNTVLHSCPDAGHPIPGVGPYLATLLLDRTHRLIGAWYDSPFAMFGIPRFGPSGMGFAMGVDGTVFVVKENLPHA